MESISRRHALADLFPGNAKESVDLGGSMKFMAEKKEAYSCYKQNLGHSACSQPNDTAAKGNFRFQNSLAFFTDHKDVLNNILVSGMQY